MSDNTHGFFHNLDRSAILTVLGILLFFSSAVTVTLIAPSFIEKGWVEPASAYQVQMHTVADPNLYISNQGMEDRELQLVYHLREDSTLLAFSETEVVRIVAPRDLEQYVTRQGEEELKLTSKLMMLRRPKTTPTFDAVAAAAAIHQQLQNSAVAAGKPKIDYGFWELFVPDSGGKAFALAETDGVLENWVDDNYRILDDTSRQPWHRDPGVVYVANPKEFRVRDVHFGTTKGWEYDPEGEPVADLQTLQSKKYGFLSRAELIDMGEDIYRIEGCWYCHSDQTRTLIQDLVLNGSASEPAPPSTPNEYVFNKVTFPATRRIGPDLSRVGVKRPSRDWHKSHFWSPKTASAGTIMPAFRHFFDNDPRGTARAPYGVPNYKFEAVFQYLMTKGTRITPPTQAWWLGKDPIQTKAIIEGRRGLIRGRKKS